MKYSDTFRGEKVLFTSKTGEKFTGILVDLVEQVKDDAAPRTANIFLFKSPVEFVFSVPYSAKRLGSEDEQPGTFRFITREPYAASARPGLDFDEEEPEEVNEPEPESTEVKHEPSSTQEGADTKAPIKPPEEV